jgi:hypothetical protein
MLWQCKVLCLEWVAQHFKAVAAEIWAVKVVADLAAVTWVAADLVKVAVDLAKVVVGLVRAVAGLARVVVGLVAKVDSVMATMACN